MFSRKNKKGNEFLLVIYKKDLSVDLDRILISDKLSNVKEYVYALHTDATEAHYHVYIKFEKKITQDELKKVFYNSKIFVSDISDSDTILSVLYYFTDGFRLPFESNYSTKIEERRKANNK